MTTLRLIAFIVGIAAFFVAAARLATTVSPLWGPLLLLCILISVLVLVGVLATVPAVERWEAWSKQSDWRRLRWYDSTMRQRRVQQGSDRENADLIADRDEWKQAATEMSAELNRIYPELKDLQQFRREHGRRAGDKDL